MRFVSDLLTTVPATTTSEQPTANNSFVKETGSEAGLTALHLACRSGKEEIIRLLLANVETDPNSVTKISGTAPFHLAAKNGHIGTVNLLLGRVKINLQDRQGKNALMFASVAGFCDLCRLLLDHEADPSLEDTVSYSRANQPPMILSANCDTLQ